MWGRASALLTPNSMWGRASALLTPRGIVRRINHKGDRTCAVPGPSRCWCCSHSSACRPPAARPMHPPPGPLHRCSPTSGPSTTRSRRPARRRRPSSTRGCGSSTVSTMRRPCARSERRSGSTRTAPCATGARPTRSARTSTIRSRPNARRKPTPSCRRRRRSPRGQRTPSGASSMPLRPATRTRRRATAHRAMRPSPQR